MIRHSIFSDTLRKMADTCRLTASRIGWLIKLKNRCVSNLSKPLNTSVAKISYLSGKHLERLPTDWWHHTRALCTVSRHLPTSSLRALRGVGIVMQRKETRTFFNHHKCGSLLVKRTPGDNPWEDPLHLYSTHVSRASVRQVYCHWMCGLGSLPFSMIFLSHPASSS